MEDGDVVLNSLTNEAIMVPIFTQYMAAKDVARARAVSKTWRLMIDEIQQLLFKRKWELLAVLGEPRKPNLFWVASLPHFVRQHSCNKSDSLTSLAVKYRVDVITIRVTNNLMSDYALHSRTHIYIPVTSAQELVGMAARFHYDELADRDLIVVADCIENMPQLPKSVKSAAASELAERKLSMLLGKGLRIDEDTAKFYLTCAGGNFKEAYRLAAEDEAWHQTR